MFRNVFLSKQINIKKLNKKYIAAYLARNANPKKTPNKKKLINDSSVLMSKSLIIAKTQNNKRRRSVEIKKDETLAAGINKKLREQTIDVFSDKFNLQQSL